MKIYKAKASLWWHTHLPSPTLIFPNCELPRFRLFRNDQGDLFDFCEFPLDLVAIAKINKYRFIYFLEVFIRKSLIYLYYNNTINSY